MEFSESRDAILEAFAPKLFQTSFVCNPCFQVTASHPSFLTSAPCGRRQPPSHNTFLYLDHLSCDFPDLCTVVARSWQNLSLNHPNNPSYIISPLQIFPLLRTCQFCTVCFSILPVYLEFLHHFPLPLVLNLIPS